MAYIDNVNKVLNIQPEAAPTRVRLSQNENGRNLYFTLAGNENPIPSGVTVTIIGTKPDGTVYSGTGSISNDVVLIPETVQLTAVAGVWDAKVKITSGGNTVATGRIRFLIDADTVAPGSVPSSSVLEGLVEQAQQYAETARQEAYGSPLTATTVAGMTDHTRVYVYTGSESGKTAGHWYYWNGSAWTDGGVYNSTAVQTDKTLSLMDVPADGKAVGDAIATDKTLSIADAPADAQTVGLKFSYIRDMIAGVETTTIATKSYSIGDLIIVRINDTLYEVTKAITTGTQIKSANARVTTIDEVVKSRIAGSVDNTLTQTGKAADAKVVGDELTSLKGDLSDMQDEIDSFEGISDEVKEALLSCFEHVAWTDTSGQTYYDNLKEALGLGTLMYDWDFTKSLTDTIQNRTVDLLGLTDAPTRTENGVVFNKTGQAVLLFDETFSYSDFLIGKTIQIDVAEFDPQSTSTARALRFLTIKDATASQEATYKTGLCYFEDQTPDPRWCLVTYVEGQTISYVPDSVSFMSNQTDISGHTISVYFTSSRRIKVYRDGIYKGMSENAIPEANQNGLILGNVGEDRRGGRFYNARVTGVRVYEGEVA